jgi:hypothetical protein
MESRNEALAAADIGIKAACRPSMQATQIAQACRHLKWRFIAALYAGWFPGASRSGLAHVIDFGMPDKELASSENERRVLSFRPGKAPARSRDPTPVESLAKYERTENPDDSDDYRHRMMVNAAVFVLVIGLIGAALWLADTMAAMRKNQDCVLSGRRGCTPVEVSKDRW